MISFERLTVDFRSKEDQELCRYFKKQAGARNASNIIKALVKLYVAGKVQVGK